MSEIDAEDVVEAVAPSEANAARTRAVAVSLAFSVGALVVARRKWTDEADILLLKEVAARKGHIPVFGKAMETYSAISETLAGNIHWETDAKHCRDR
jgi:hypothetical protein